jgi:ribosomal protein S6--L-glutamate ligase
MGKNEFEIEITLINRDLMGFKMLIGREALNGRFLINPARSYLLKDRSPVK